MTTTSAPNSGSLVAAHFMFEGEHCVEWLSCTIDGHWGWTVDRRDAYEFQSHEMAQRYRDLWNRRAPTRFRFPARCMLEPA